MIKFIISFFAISVLIYLLVNALKQLNSAQVKTMFLFGGLFTLSAFVLVVINFLF